jgi:antitoxin YefM
METISYTSFRNNLASILDMVNQDHKPIIVTRQNAEPAVVMSLEDFVSYEEMAHLMSSHTNVERINRSIEQLESGKGIIRDIIE